MLFRSHFPPRTGRITCMGVFFAVILLGTVVSCGPSVSHYRLIDEELKKENYAGADSVVEKNKGKYGKRNSLV